MSSRLRGRSLLVAAFLVAACAGPLPTIRTLEPPLDPSSQPSAPSPTPTAEPTPAVPTVGPLQETPRPSGAPGDNTLPARAFAERDGVRLTIEVPFNPLWAPQGAEAVVTIENRSDRTLRWSTDGCNTNAWISATTTATWRDSPRLVGQDLAPYRDWLRKWVRIKEPIELAFNRGSRQLHRSVGCADLGLPHQLEPGRSVRQTFIWDGSAAHRLGPAPNGPVTLISRFERWSLAGGGERQPIEVKLDSWIVGGRSEAYLSPAEVIDAALSDERLGSWIVTRPVGHNANPIVEFDRELGFWAVGLLLEGGFEPTMHAAFVDPISGEVFAVKEHRVTY